jgi:hypothetical protein
MCDVCARLNSLASIRSASSDDATHRADLHGQLAGKEATIENLRSCLEGAKRELHRLRDRLEFLETRS